jgi:HlyD family secretion protein
MILGAMLLLLAACSSDDLTGPTPTPQPDYDQQPSLYSDVLSANGVLLPLQQRELSFGVAGFVETVPVEMGDEVLTGQTLASLDAAELERALTAAELDLRQTQLRLEQSQEPADEVQVRLAESAVRQAAASLELARLSASTVLSGTLLNEALDDAESVYREAQNRYSDTLARYERGETVYWYVDQALQSYEEAELALSRVRQQADLQLEAAHADVAGAWDAYQQAGDALRDLQAGGDPRVIELAELDVERALLALEAAEHNLALAVLDAPFDGVVSAVGVDVGEWTAPGMLAVQLLDLSRWRVETKNVGELEIGRISVGQEVNVTVNAFRAESLTGYVVAISPVAIVQQGDTTYTLLIELQETDLPVRPGMTVRVEIPLAD